MTTVCEKGKCTGCMECIDICPKKAIKVIDSWQEYNAVIDTEQCIQCNACHNACQNNVKQILTKPIYWKQGWAQDNCIRMRSSSGGVAAAIERAFIKMEESFVAVHLILESLSLILQSRKMK